MYKHHVNKNTYKHYVTEYTIDMSLSMQICQSISPSVHQSVSQSTITAAYQCWNKLTNSKSANGTPNVWHTRINWEIIYASTDILVITRMTVITINNYMNGNSGCVAIATAVEGTCLWHNCRMHETVGWVTGTGAINPGCSSLSLPLGVTTGSSSVPV